MENQRFPFCSTRSTQDGEEMRNTRTLRGQISATGGKGEKQLILNDQLINRGLRVTGFFVWPSIMDVNADETFNAILSYAPLANASVTMDAGDNTQIGWSFYSQTLAGAGTSAKTNSGFFNQLIDPDHIINRDLVISLRETTDNMVLNYLITCELMTLTDDQAIITIIKENSQAIQPV